MSNNNVASMSYPHRQAWERSETEKLINTIRNWAEVENGKVMIKVYKSHRSVNAADTFSLEMKIIYLLRCFLTLSLLKDAVFKQTFNNSCTNWMYLSYKYQRRKLVEEECGRVWTWKIVAQFDFKTELNEC